MDTSADTHGAGTTSTTSKLLIAGLASLALLVSILGTAPRSAAADEPLALYDTAWELPFFAQSSEIEIYFDQLEQSGYTGVWISLMNHMTSEKQDAISPVFGTTQATLDASGEFDLTPTYRARVLSILDEADSHGLRVGLVPMWGVAYLHTNNAGNCSGTNMGPLTVDNAQEWGNEVATAFGNHPALEAWVLGGDNFCSPSEDVNVWRNMSAGIRAAGASQDITYHSGGWDERQREFADESWIDFLSPQNGHCNSPAKTQQQLSFLVSTYGKPVVAAELRYETIEPGWNCPEHGPGDPVLAADIVDDANAALAAGVTGILYGHNERWQWGR
ncbi:MAG: DUF4038 domain-containing protein, partial [Acidimicrobiales bacterium]